MNTNEAFQYIKDECEKNIKSLEYGIQKGKDEQGEPVDDSDTLLFVGMQQGIEIALKHVKTAQYWVNKYQAG